MQRYQDKVDKQNQNQQNNNNSNWDKVKHAFLTPSGNNKVFVEGSQSLKNIKIENSKKYSGSFSPGDERDMSDASYGGSLPPSPNNKRSFTFEGEEVTRNLQTQLLISVAWEEMNCVIC